MPRQNTCTSVRLRRLTDRVHREHADTSELRQELLLVEEKESQLNKEAERLEENVQGMRSVVSNLERSLQRHARGFHPADLLDSFGDTPGCFVTC